MLPILITVLIPYVASHGYLQEPPSRSSMWRFGFNTPHNYDDNQLFCGGFDRQWNRNGGKCGICGDPWDGVRENEAGGKYATGIISRRYKEGQIIEIKVKITASHRGYFEFRLCPNNDINKPATQACLDRYILHQPTGSARFMEQGRPQTYSLKLKLPKGLTCSQCVLQWKYNAGNSYGIGPNEQSCKGCGNQEQFYGCADVAIGSANGVHIQNNIPQNSYNQQNTFHQNSHKPVQQQIDRPYQPHVVIGNIQQTCTATSAFRAMSPKADSWCISNCKYGYCPGLYCNTGCQRLHG